MKNDHLQSYEFSEWKNLYRKNEKVLGGTKKGAFKDFKILQ